MQSPIAYCSATDSNLCPHGRNSFERFEKVSFCFDWGEQIVSGTTLVSIWADNKRLISESTAISGCLVIICLSFPWLRDTYVMSFNVNDQFSLLSNRILITAHAIESNFDWLIENYHTCTGVCHEIKCMVKWSSNTFSELNDQIFTLRVQLFDSSC